MTRVKVLTMLAISMLLEVSVAADGPSRADVLRYFESTQALASIARQVEAMRRESRKLYCEYPPEFWDELNELYAKYESDLIDAYVLVAMQNLTKEELDEILEFLQTESGQRYLELTNRLLPIFDQSISSVYEPFVSEFAKLAYKYAP